jgi:hypothetical protein
MANARVEMDERGLYELLESETGPVGRDIMRRTLAVEARAVALCPVDEGRLRASIDHEVGRDQHGLYGRVGTNVDYAIHVERGTGVFEETVPGLAPSKNKGRRITADDGGMLRFEIGGVVFYRRSIKGMQPQPFLRPALDAAED